VKPCSSEKVVASHWLTNQSHTLEDMWIPLLTLISFSTEAREICLSLTQRTEKFHLPTLETLYPLTDSALNQLADIQHPHPEISREDHLQQARVVRYVVTKGKFEDSGIIT
jgi:hypothetical protein